ncbi:hypothetical protein [Vibrio marisflavi]|uniref:Uncharacterized protein n=1 Tax=Vibrio marisflavi CECT 7928 TaxID=634439 RepID=A0ABN8DZY5_9VIBR|nr:hypothetical protein [Vibrio marisflavi]CAH0536012.1 hypothetical protein VMF7928_00108 [Vibrio marisflavi CECT 7928]
MSSSISVEKSIADLARQHKELEKLIQEFQSLRGEVQTLQTKAEHNPALAEKLAQVQTVLEREVGPKGELVKGAFAEMKQEALKVQQGFKLPVAADASPGSKDKKEAKKFKSRQFI